MKTDVPWQHVFKICLAQRKFNISMLEYLDDILDWYSKRNSDQRSESIRSLISKYGEHEFRIRFEEVLSQFLTLHTALLFPVNLDQGQAKLRYRLLIRAFHPDRGVSDTQWLTTCAEIINSTYKEFVDKFEEQERRAELLWSEVLAYDVDALEGHRENRSQSINSNNNGVRSILWLKAEYWRNILGDPENLQYKIVYSLMSLVIIILAVVMSSIVLEPINVINSVTEKKPRSIEQQLLAEIGPTDRIVSVPDEDSSSEVNQDRGVVNKQISSIGLLSHPTSKAGSTVTKVVDSVEERTLNSEQDLSDKSESLDFVVLTDLALGNDFQEQNLDINQELLQQKENSDKLSSLMNDSILKTSIAVESISTGRLTTEEKTSASCIEPEGVAIVSPVVGGVVDAEGLRLRSGPSAECSIKISLLHGRPVRILSYSPDRLWLYVSVHRKSRREIFGWVSNQYITILDEITQFEDEYELVDKQKPKSDIALGETQNTKIMAHVDTLKQVYYNDPIFDPAMQTILQEYQDYFMAGDDLQLASLYINSANENGIRGVADIKQFYKELFAATKHRNLALEISNIETDGYYSAQIIGRIKIGYIIDSNQIDDLQDFKMFLIKTQKGLKIALFNFG